MYVVQVVVCVCCQKLLLMINERLKRLVQVINPLHEDVAKMKHLWGINYFFLCTLFIVYGLFYQFIL